MPTKAELKAKENPVKLKVRKGDRVMVIAGKDKGQTGFVERVLIDKQKVIILQDNDENPDQPLPLNAAIKHRKRRTEGEKSARIKIPVPIHVSNVMLLDPKTGDPSRIGRRKEDGKTVRYAKKSGEKIEDTPVMESKK
jgi:large subunit ribosomal protein L24